MKRVLALLMVLAMVLTAVPAVFAETGIVHEVTNQTVTADNATGAIAWYVYEGTATADGTLSVSAAGNPGYQYHVTIGGEESLPQYADSSWEITAGQAYSIKVCAYDNAGWTAVTGTIDLTVSFTAGEISKVEKSEYTFDNTVLTVGENNLTLNANAVNTLYTFTPDEIGVYTFTVAEGATVGYWGAGSFYVANPNSTATSIETEIKQVGQSAVIGIASENPTVTLTVTKSGESAGIVEATYIPWENKITPTAVTIPALTKVDITESHTAVKINDGEYRLDSEYGPILYVNLKNGEWNITDVVPSAFTIRAEYEGVHYNFRAPLEAYNNGENYGIAAYYDVMKANNKYRYPLTTDLLAFIKGWGKAQGWQGAATSPFAAVQAGTADPDTAWMAVCLYDPNSEIIPDETVLPEVDFADLKDGDLILVTMHGAVTDKDYVMKNNANKGPAAVFTGDAFDETMMWIVDKTENGVILFANAEGGCLSVTDTDNGAVISETVCEWTLADNGYLTANGRYLGVYDNNNGSTTTSDGKEIVPNFRTYTNVTGNIKNQTLTLYLVGEGADVPEVEIPVEPTYPDPATATAQEILDAAYALETGAAMGSDAYTLTGEITSIDEAYSEQYKNITVTIAVEGVTGANTTIQCYRLKGEGADTLAVGDVIKVTGKIKNYNGTVEFDTGCTFVLIEKGETQPPVVEPTYPDPATATAQEILDAAYALETGAAMGSDAYTLTGEITSIDEAYSEQYKNITVTIAVEGVTGANTTIQCFRMKGEGADTLAVGDVIKVTGKIINYNGTVEFNSGCTFELIEKAVVEPTEESITLNTGDNKVTLLPNVNYNLSMGEGVDMASTLTWGEGITVTVNGAVVTSPYALSNIMGMAWIVATVEAETAANFVITAPAPVELPELVLGENAVDVVGEALRDFTAAEAGTYVLSAAEGETNADVYIETATGSEWAELPYEFTLAEGETITFIVYTYDWSNDTIDLVLSKKAEEPVEPVEEFVTLYTGENKLTLVPNTNYSIFFDLGSADVNGSELSWTGDVVVTVNGIEITSPYDLSGYKKGTAIVATVAAETEVTFVVTIPVEEGNEPLTLGENAVDVVGEALRDFTAAEAGTYVLSAAEGETNADVYFETAYGSEWAELPYEFTLAEGETITFIVYTYDWSNDTIDLVLSKKAEEVGCKHENKTLIEGKRATCTEDGNIAYYLCADCGVMLDADGNELTIEEVTIKAMGHDKPEYIAAVKPTCTEQGNKEYWLCGACGKYLLKDNENQIWIEITREDIVLIPIGHERAEKIDAKPATHTEMGNIEYYLCGVCGEYLLKDNETQTWDVVTREDVIILPMGHTHAEKIEAVKPTCTENGNIEYWYCAICDAYFTDRTANGEELAEGEWILNAMGHDKPEYIAAVKPTCTEQGNKEYWLCGVCGKYLLKDNENQTWIEITREDIVLIPIGHDRPEKIEAKPATHTEMGNIEYYLCGVCGEYLLKNDEAQEWEVVDRLDIVILPSGHIRAEHVPGKEATTTEEGIVEHWHCAECGKNYTDRSPDAEEIENVIIPVKTPADTPVTGDETALLALVALAVMGVLGVATVSVLKKRAI